MTQGADLTLLGPMAGTALDFMRQQIGRMLTG